FDAGPASSGDYALMIDPHAAPHLREYQMLSALNSEFRIHKNIAINAETTMRDCILTLAQIVESRARLTPSRIVARDLTRSLTCDAWNTRANRLAHGLIGLGLNKGDRVAVLAYNCLEWAEIYIATAKAGLIAVPINFRLNAHEIQFIVQD